MTLFPDVRTDELVARARAHFTPNYRQAPVFFVRGEGVWLWDRDGRRYLDLIGGIAVSSLGHAHPRLVAAIRDQAEKVVHVSNLYFHEPALALMEKLCEVSFGDRVFFANSGAEANEAALKLCRRYWSVVRGEPGKTDVLAFHQSFHGRTVATVTLTGQPQYQKGFEPLLPGVHHAEFGDVSAIEAALDLAGGRIGTVFMEPIQCEGGLRIPPEGFLRAVRKLCTERGILLVLDEVQTGVGRTGEWFCYEIEGAAPDVMTLAKGLGGGVPVAAMVANEEVARAFEPGTHATTFGGNPLATRAALEVLRTIEEESLLDHVYEVGEHLGRGLDEVVRRHPSRCREARGFGLLRGLELRTDVPDLGTRVVDGAREKGVLLNLIAGKVLRFAPPYVIEPGHVDLALEVLDEVLGSAA
jgi:predicted acetylornithine/succinylornithine family transaminase